MVDQVGGKPFSVGERSVDRVERTAGPRAVETPRTEARRPAAQGFSPVARELAASPPVDFERVARIRKAVAEGRFPITPATVADNLLALRYGWTSNDEA